MSDTNPPQTSELTSALSMPLNPNYKRLGLPAIIFAWFIVIILVLTMLLGVYGILVSLGNAPAAAAFGLIGLYLTYLHYTVVATAVNCDKQMYSLDPTFPQY